MTAPPAILQVLLRLFLGAADATPRGIDRVDLGYARYLCDHWPGEYFGVLPALGGSRLFDRARVMRGLARLEHLWRETVEAGADPVLAQLRRRLAGQAAGEAGPARAAAPGGWGGLRALLGETGLSMGIGAVGRAPCNAVYLNIGQLGWAAPWTTHWLRRRPDIRPVFLLHDAIPVERRDLVSGLGHWTHRMMLRSVARHAAGLIVTTDSAAESVLAALRARGHPPVPTARIPLPVAPVFLSRAAADPGLAWPPYFLVCGAIEPRKNLLMLLRVWQTLLARFGAAAPLLVIAGAPARGGREILQRIAECTPLRGHVIVVSGLSSPALRQVMAQARALLMPSLAEGFGLPVIEALTLGTPVLASALPAHRDPLDDEAWGAEIGRLMQDASYLAALRARCTGYRPLTQAAYFARAAGFLAGFG